MTEAWQCWQCGEFYPRRIEYFRPQKNTSAGLSGNCRFCTNANKRRLRAIKKAAANLPPKLTPAERSKRDRARKKRERFAQVTKGLR